MPNPVVMRLALVTFALGLAATALAAEHWAIPAGQEAVLDHALATTPAWPKGWTYTGAMIHQDAVDVRYRDPEGIGRGVRLQHAQFSGGPRQAGQFEIANISAELPEPVLAQLKLQLETMPTFTWTQLHDRDGDPKADAPASPTPTLAQVDAAPVLVTPENVDLLACQGDPNPQQCQQRLQFRRAAMRWLPEGAAVILVGFALWLWRRRARQTQD